MSFAITVLPAVDGHRWVRMTGPLDRSTAADVRDVLRVALRGGRTRRLTIDVSGAQVRDEAGWRSLHDAAELARTDGVELFTFDGHDCKPGLSLPRPPAVRPLPAAGRPTQGAAVSVPTASELTRRAEPVRPAAPVLTRFAA